jgi:NADPH:quinone reductase-like Zn-dependent oxidoreductase
VGSWAIRIAKAFGCSRITVTAGSAASRAYLRDELGLLDNQILDYAGRDREALASAATALNNGSLFDMALDCVGGSMTALCCDVVDFGGNVTVLVNAPAATANAQAAVCEEVLFARAATVHFELVFSESEYAGPQRLQRYSCDLQTLVQMIESDILKLPKVTLLGSMSAAIVREAHRLLEAGHVRGKLVASVE